MAPKWFDHWTTWAGRQSPQNSQHWLTLKRNALLTEYQLRYCNGHFPRLTVPVKGSWGHFWRETMQIFLQSRCPYIHLYKWHLLLTFEWRLMECSTQTGYTLTQKVKTFTELQLVNNETISKHISSTWSLGTYASRHVKSNLRQVFSVNRLASNSIKVMDRILITKNTSCSVVTRWEPA